MLACCRPRSLVGVALALLMSLWLPGPSALTRAQEATDRCLTRDGDLVQADGPEIFLVQAGALRWVPDVETLEALNTNASAITILDRDCLLGMPQGPAIPSLVRGTPSQPATAVAAVETPSLPPPTILAPSGVLQDSAFRLSASSTDLGVGGSVSLTAVLDGDARSATLTIQRLRNPGGPPGGLVANCREAASCSGQAQSAVPGSVPYLATLYRCDNRGACTAERSSNTVIVTWR